LGTKVAESHVRVEHIAWIEEVSKALEQEPIRLKFLKEALTVSSLVFYETER